MFPAETRRLGLLEIKAKDDPRVNSVAAVAIWVGIIPVIRGSPVIRPIVVLPVINSGGVANDKFVHKGSCVQLRSDSCSF